MGPRREVVPERLIASVEPLNDIRRRGYAHRHNVDRYFSVALTETPDIFCNEVNLEIALRHSRADHAGQQYQDRYRVPRIHRTIIRNPL